MTNNQEMPIHSVCRFTPFIRHPEGVKNRDIRHPEGVKNRDKNQTNLKFQESNIKKANILFGYG